ncbi:hypothetical protein NDN08_007305 [Rhodosorus marinus]|uniref:Uncharacterized protein n=1 Tax=Rhodosorus marinus TaxID=101924 RepID=A0AAV8UG55_9RHOD|nr:hypothetical protein NDN08_007305 [Rhodosorus marinus]
MAFVFHGVGGVSGRTRQRRVCQRRVGVVRHVEEGPEDYIALGIAVCYKERVRGELEEVVVVEPLSSATLENISSMDVPTSYKKIMGIKLGEVPEQVNDLPGSFIDGDRAVWGENFQERANAAARTFLRRPEAKLLDLGEISTKIQFSTERKRILDSTWEPNFDDNVKQDISIDVYNREADDLANS